MTNLNEARDNGRERVLSLRGISKNFGAVSALTNIDLDVHAGEVVALVGDNGAGKSTLVKILAGVHQPSSGSITFRGKPVTLDDQPRGTALLAVDSVGAGVHEKVLVVIEGRAAGEALGRKGAPVDAAIVGIVDAVDVSE